jgi:chlorobactene glucosyltransferase
MTILVGGLAWLALVLLLLARAMRQLRLYCTLPPTGGALPWPPPTVAVVVPARDEAANLATLLASLSAQDYPARQLAILVIDDGSRDATASLAERAGRADRRVSLHAAGPLPEGWLGKPHACWLGALQAGPVDWLCFIDADVRAAPQLLAAAIGRAERDGLDMLSLHPFQELGSLSEQLVIPAGLLVIACARDRGDLADRGSGDAEANGQFILIRRSAYLAVGGHEAVRGMVCEDRALAQRVKAAGLSLGVLCADRLAATRMYRDLGALWEGFAKNAVEIMGDARRTLLAAAASLAVAWAIPLLPLAVALSAAAPGAAPERLLGLGFAVLGSAIAVAVVVGTLRRFRCPAWLALLFPVAVSLVAAIAWCSVRARRAGRVTWKRRRYRLGPGPAGPDPLG